jgi:parallel beta-helix repeat protein
MKKTALAVSLGLILLFSFFSCGTLVQPVEAQSFDTIYIRDDGSVEGTNLIERRGNTYTFLNNISGNIVVSRDFITLDGSGYALIGTEGSSQKGISLSNRKNVTVANMVILNYFVGVSCGGTTGNITFLNNYVSSCGIGIEFLGSSNNLIIYNTFRNNDIAIAVNYVSGNNFVKYNNLDSYVQVWLSNQPTMDMNFWADYNGTDKDGDGIGDSPYFYHNILQDNHPLMEPVSSIPEFPSWAILPLFIITTILLMLVYFKKHKH